MTAMRKVTMNLPAELLDGLPMLSGKTMTESMRIALVDYRHKLACEKLLALRGTMKFGATYEELTGKDDPDPW